MSALDQRHEEGHTLLTKVMQDVGHLLSYRGVIDWWLAENHPALEAHRADLDSLPTAVGVSE